MVTTIRCCARFTCAGLGLSDLWFRPPPEPVSDEDGNPINPIVHEGEAAATTGEEKVEEESGGFATLEASEKLTIVTRYVAVRSGKFVTTGSNFCPGRQQQALA